MRLVEAARPMLEHFHQAGFVQRRIRVGRAYQRGHPTGDRRSHFAFQRGLVLETGLAQSGRQIDQSRANNHSRCVDGAVGMEIGRRRSNGCNLSGRNENVLDLVDCTAGIDDAAALDLDLHAFPARMDITAMRTAMPNVTCGRITDCRPSATLDSISMPRFIGPGCITIASGFAWASFSGVSP